MARRANSKTKNASEAPEVELSTRERILEVSRRMFNHDGVQSTAMFKIAAELAMSPGNLTYHFKSKADIIRELADHLDVSIKSALSEFKSPPEPRDVVRGNEKMFQTLWASRFFFNSAIYLSRTEEDLADRLRQVHKMLYTALASYMEKLIARRDMRAPRHPDGVKLLTENLVAVWMQWLRFQNIETPEAEEPGKRAIRAGMEHHFSIMDPYFSKSFSDEIWTEIDRRF